MQNFEEEIIYAHSSNIGITIDHRSHVDKICRILNEIGVRREFITGIVCNSILCYKPDVGYLIGDLRYDSYVNPHPSCDKLVTSTYFLKNVNKTILFDRLKQEG